MDVQAKDFLKNGKFDQLADLLQGVQDSELTSIIQRHLIKSSEPVDIIRAILAGSRGDDDSNESRKILVYRQCLSVIKGNELNSKTVSELIGVLMLEVDSLKASNLAELAGMYVEAIKEGLDGNTKFLELFPKILSTLDSVELVRYNRNSMKGTEYKSHVLNALCSGRWDPSNAIHIATMFRDIPTSEEELKFVINKIMKMFKDIEIQELPALVYQLLLLSSKGHKKMVLEGVSSYFTQQDILYKEQQEKEGTDDLFESDGPSDQLQYIEGTIILHITFAVKQDQELGREFVKCLKAGQRATQKRALSPFNVALALSIAKIHRFEDQIFDFLKSAVLNSYKDCEKQDGSQWVRQMVPDSCSIASLLLDTVKNSTSGWDHVTQGLVQLGFALMDSFGPKAVFGRIRDTLPTANLTPSQQACKLGLEILYGTFKAHDMVRSEILQQILNRIVTKATTPVTHYMDLLAKATTSAPQIFLDCLPKIREAFDYLSFLPPPTAEALMKAIQPLLKISISLRDSLILVLRKAMFSKQRDARKIAVNGFLMILRNFKVLGPLVSSQASQSSASFSLSQVQVDVHIPHNPNSNEALCLEILGNLRRCLSQQADVRLALYEGLYDAVTTNLQLGIPVLVILLHQFKRYYVQQEDFVPPVQLENCTFTQGDETSAAEPLGHLLCCIIQCYLKVIETKNTGIDDNMDDDEEDVPAEADTVLKSLSTRLLQSSMEDFHLDKHANFSMSTTVGMKNNINAVLMTDVYETLIEYKYFMNTEMSEDENKTIVELYTLGQNYSDLLKEKTISNKKGKSSALTVRDSLLSLKFLTLILHGIYCDNLPNRQSGFDVFRGELEFQKYLVTTLLHKCQKIQNTGRCSGPDGHNPQKLFKHLCVAARTLVARYTQEVNTFDENKTEKVRQFSVLCLETVVVIQNVITTRYKNRLGEYLACVDQIREDQTEAEETRNNLIQKHISKYQRMLVSMLGNNEDGRSPKEAVHLINLIESLSEHLSSSSQQLVDLHSWVESRARDLNIDDAMVAKSFIGLMFCVVAQVKTSVSVIIKMSRDVHVLQGDVDEEAELEEENNFSIINLRNVVAAGLLLINKIETELDDTDWVIGMNKAQLGASLEQGSSDLDSTQQEVAEDKICTRIGRLAQAVFELVQTALPPTNIETLIKVTIRLYNTLTLLVKFYLWLHQQKIGQISCSFEKLVKYSGNALTPSVYQMITYAQTRQNEILQQASEKGKKKAKDNVTTIGKNMVMKESKVIPNLIFSIEQYQKFLIQLNKKTKVNLMDHFKMSTSRDFRITASVLQDKLDDLEPSSDSDNETTQPSPGSNDQEENEEPSAKKQKKSENGPTGVKRKLGLANRGVST